MTLPLEIVPDAGGRASRKRVPGEREPGMLTRFAATMPRVPEGVSTLDAATIAERQREGGGGPSQRPPARDRSRP